MAGHDDPNYPGCPVTVAEAVQRGVVLRPARWGLGDVISMVLLTLAIAAGGAALLTYLHAPLALTVLAGTLLSWVGFLGWPGLATRLRGNGPIIDLGLRLSWSDVRSGIVGGVLALVAASVMAVIVARFIGVFESSASIAAATLIDEGDRLAVIVLALMIMIGAPIVEEIAFRGLAFSALRKRGLGAFWSVALSAVLFAIVHIEPARLLVLLAVGAVLGAVRARTGSTGASIMAHVVVNAPGAVFLLLGVPGMTP